MFEAQLARAESLRGSKRLGQRTDALVALAAAAKIKVTPALRAAAIAALAQTDLRLGERGPARPGGDLAFAFAPDLETSVTEQEPGLIEWRVGLQGEIKTRLDARAAGRVTSQATFSPDGRFLLTRHGDHTVRLWSLGEGRVIAVFPCEPLEDPELAFELAWRPDSGEFALPRPGGGLTFYSADDGRETRRWENALAPDLVRFSPDGSLIAAARGKKVVVLDSAALAERASAELESTSRVIAWHPNSKAVALGAVDGGIRVLNAASGIVEQQLAGHRASLLSLAYFPDGGLAISYGKDSATRLWDTRTGDALVVLPSLGGRGDVQFSRDGRRAGLPHFDTCGLLVELIRPTVVRECAAARPRDIGSLIGGLDFSRDGSRLAVATWGGVEVVETASGRTLASFPMPDGKREECSAIFAPDDSALYAANVTRGVRRHRPTTGGSFDEGELVDAEKNWLLSDIAVDGTQLVLVNRADGKIKITDSNGALVKPFTKHPSAMFTAMSPDRKWLATQSSGRGEAAKMGARVWSLNDETLAKEFAAGPLGFVSFSGDGRWLGAAGLNGFELVRVGDWIAPHNGLPPEVKKGGAVVSLAADGELAAVTVNEKVYLLHPATGEERGLIVSPSGNPSTARARLDAAGRHLAVMWDDGAFDLWDLGALREQLTALGM